MIRHIALFRFKDEVTPADIDRLDAGLRALPSKIDTIQAYATGRDLGISEGAWDYAVVGDFADVDGYQAYHTHPAHQEVLETLTRPLTAELKRIQFEIG